ncbi:serine protease [Hyphomicrobium sp. CS1BSMeth3]|uniref:trypsin-like serine peptidase n=1 Tax=Hyphomicrobium sp. CS1BSMeth3 TaxID=1892844 RepID=UPI0009F81B60|nr:serine protease [Hyphomicrobium sp. CS1BSMeth3]
MKQMTPKQQSRIAEQYGAMVAGLTDELKTKLAKASVAESSEAALFRTVMAKRVVEPSAELPPLPMEDAVDERIIVVTAGARPVARIRDNQVTTEFIGPDSKSWGKVIDASRNLINRAIPAVGRIELNNSDYPWAGTGWMIEPGIIVTNRHVAEVFAKVDRRTSRLMFKPGLTGGEVSADIDFLEEENRLDSAEHPITSVLWMAPSTEADVAFLQVTKAAGLSLPDPIELIDHIRPDQIIAAIGYPARDPSIRDQDLVLSIFGSDVYDKKRFSPGRVMSVDGHRIKHDCSTLGGNSGSVLLELETGRAIGIHRAGLVDDSANLGVTASHLRSLLARIPRGGRVLPKSPPRVHGSEETQTPPLPQPIPEGFRMKLYVPIEIIVNVGSPVQHPTAPSGAGTLRQIMPWQGDSLEAALQEARIRFASYPGVISIRPGYRFKNRWITDERVVVIEMKEKRAFGDLMATGTAPLPREILGVGVDVRTARCRISWRRSASIWPSSNVRLGRPPIPSLRATTTRTRRWPWRR